ncbi:MAG: translocation/assembly module TamB domain-containing protein [Roseobacter sp.]
MKQVLVFSFMAMTLAPAAQAQDEDDGGGFLTRTIEGALSGAGREVNIIGFAGALSSEATFEQMTIADAQGIWLTLDDVSLIWSRTALLRGRLEVNSLTAQLLKVERLPEPGETPVEVPSAEAEEFSLELPELPVSINLESFEVAEIDLGAPIIGEPVRLALQAAVRLDDDGLFLDMAANRLDEVAGTFGIKANIERDGAEIDLDLALQEEPGGITARLMALPDLPSVDLKIAGIGPLDDFSADIDLATDDAPRLKGQVILSAEPVQGSDAEINRRIQADLGGDITALIAPQYHSFFGPDVGLVMNTVLEASGGIDVQEFSLDAEAVDLAGTVRLNRDLWPAFVDVKGEIAQDGNDVVLPGSDAGVSIRSVTLDVAFDATKGDKLTGVFDIRDLKHEAAQIDQIALKVDGLLDGSVDTIGKLVADVTLDAIGVQLQDEDAASALGDKISAGTKITYLDGAPIEITGLTLAGPDFDLRGDVIIEGLDNGFPTDLNVDINASDLSRFAALAGQPLEGAAELSVIGNVVPLSSMFDLEIRGETQDVVVGIAQADALLQGRSTVSLGAARNVTGTFLRDLRINNQALDVSASAELRSAGSDVQARLRLADIALVAPQYEGAIALDATARQTEEGWKIETDLRAPYDSTASISGLATGPDADLTFEVSVPEVNPFLDGANGPLQADGRLWQSEQGYQIDVKAGGPFDATLDVQGVATGTDAKVTFDAGLPDMGVLMAELTGALALNGEVARAGEEWAVETRLEGPAGLAADISGTAASDASTIDMGIKGQVPLSMAGPFLAPSSLTGPAAFDLTVKGAPSLEALSGTITTSDVAFSDPNLRLGLEDISTRVDLANNNAQIDLGADFVTGGRLQVDGSLNLVSLAADLAIALRDAVLIDPNLYAATLGADIAIEGPLTGGARISGDIDLEEVNVTVPGTGVTSIGVIPEIQHIGASNRVTQTRARAGVLPKETKEGASGESPVYRLALNINAPSQIFIRGRGLNAEMGGDLQVRGDTSNIVSSGSFDLIRGRLDIIGKRFELDEGSVQFQGAVTPYILFVTTTEIPDGTASISVEGLASEPEITFSSEPEAAEDEVLALILFGRYVSELSAFQALQLANGVSQLSGRGGLDVIGGLREGIGLDELDVTTDEEGSTSVSAGKYITDTIYTDVTSNSDKGTDISLNIDLTDSLIGKATVAEDGDSSVGLFFERDY